MVDDTFRNMIPIRETDNIRTCHATRATDDKPVVVYTLRKKNLGKSDLTRFLKEYETIKTLIHPGIVQTLDVVDKKNEILLELEDYHEKPIADVLKTKRLTPDEFIHVALELAGILEEIHSRKMFHGNVNGHSILVSSDLSRAKVTEFGIDLLVTGARDSMYDADYINQYLPYMAPEQTGRVNRSEDYRSDFYSLGVVFFHMLTGTVPFRSSDPLELIHCHIAREPALPEDMLPDIPATLWDIVWKLLAKSPEERYQSAAGLKEDLLECQKRMNAQGKFIPFEIGSKDIPDRFLVPLKLYGRETEMDILLDTFKDVSKGNNRLLLVTGESGIGKSALIHEIHKPVLAHRGYFISGKYEQYKSDSPYSAIIQAFKGLLHQLLSEKEKTLAAWRNNFKAVMGPNGGVITDIFPELTLIVGEQPPPPQVGPEESRNRFNLCFESFVSLFVTGQRPLVLFLDDLQWVDFPSISLLTSLLFSLETKYLYIIFSYRNNEVSDAHPFMEMINDIRNQGQNPDTITLGPLSNDLVRNMILDFLKCTPEQAHSLGDQIFKKTAGNPFFVNQFLKTLYDKGVIVHDPGKGWVWDDRDITAMQVTTNVLTLMTDKLSDLPEKTRETLKISSCIGNHFDPELLSDVLEKSLYDVLTDLKIAIDEGYVHHDGTMFKYNHDRIQEAAYSLISESERAQFHLKIGQILLKQATHPQDLEKQLFYITDQLNLGSALIDRIGGRETLFYLNMDAGRKAKETAAFDPALKYFLKAEKLLSGDVGDKTGDSFLSLYQEIADGACLIGHYDLMDTYIKKAIALSPSIIRRVPLAEIEIRSHFARQDYQAAIDTSKHILNDLGIVFPEKVRKKHIIRELIKVKIKLRPMKEDTLLALPAMEDERQLAIAKIYYEMGISATLTDSVLYGYIILKRFGQVLNHGQHPYAGLCFLGYGALLATALHDIKSGIRFANLALALVKRPENSVARHKVHVIYTALVSHWTFSMEKCRSFALNAYQVSREAGDQIYTALALMYQDFMAYMTSENMPDLVIQMANRVKITEKSGQRPMILFHKMILQLTRHMSQGTVTPGHLTGELFDDGAVIPEWIESKNHTALGHYYVILLTDYYYYGLYDEALACVDALKPHWQEIQNMMAGQLVIYFECLIHLARYKTLSAKEKKKALASVKTNLKKIIRWEKLESSKQTPWIDLINAELARVHGNDTDAPVLYAKAREGFQRIPGPIFHCVSLILTGKYYNERGLMHESRFWMTTAVETAKKTGHIKFAHSFTQQFQDILGQTSEDAPSNKETSPEGSLDIATIIKSAQALSGEIVLSKLMKTIMTISLESAGAQKGYLILPHGEELTVVVESHVDSQDGGEHTSALPIEQRRDLAVSVINYVVRTLKPIVLDNASVEGDFTSDPYISKHTVKSLLVAPMVGSGKLKGVIYLENNLATHVFSEERIRILDVLASQAAISLENARLFDSVMKAEADVRTINLELEDRVEQRTYELKAAYEQIMGSIRYAGVIQHSLLPSAKDIEQFLHQCFFIWQPRDIVGGDIYTCDRVEGGILISVIDCTGHGVPGAFMTMLAGSAIRRIIREEQIHAPAEILKRLNRIIKALLHQDKEGTMSDDGLDAGICFYHTGEKTLYFAGAGIPLFSVNETGLSVIKGDRQSIGYASSDTDFEYTTHAIDNADQSRTYYLATDGYPDQLGGPKHKRFGTRRFKEALMKTHQLPIDEQKDALFRVLDEHKGGNRQTDDITMAGFRF